MLDALVIGAGFGGLGAALRLAEGGARVALCETLKYPGGCASTFERGGHRYGAESGGHVGVLLHQHRAIVGRVRVVRPVLVPPGEAAEIRPAATEQVGQRGLHPGSRRAPRVVIGDSHLEDEKRLDRGGGAQLREHVVQQRAKARAAVIIWPFRAIGRDPDPVDHVVAGIVGRGDVPGVVARIVLGIVMKGPSDVVRPPAAHQLDDVAVGALELARANAEPAVVGRAPGIPVAVDLGAVLDDERRAELPGGVGPGRQIGVKLSRRDAIGSEGGVDEQHLALAPQHQAHEGNRAARADQAGGVGREGARAEPVVVEVDEGDAAADGAFVDVQVVRGHVAVGLIPTGRKHAVVKAARPSERLSTRLAPAAAESRSFLRRLCRATRKIRLYFSGPAPASSGGMPADPRLPLPARARRRGRPVAIGRP